MTLTGASYERVLCGSDTRADGILLGCAVALFVAERGIPHIGARLAALGIFVLALSFFAPVIAAIFLSAVASVVLVAWAATADVRWLSARPLVYLGTISYGLYLWHAPFMRTARDLEWSLWAAPALFAITFLAAWLSHRYVEQPFLRLKYRPAPRQLPSSEAASTTTA